MLFWNLCRNDERHFLIAQIGRHDRFPLHLRYLVKRLRGLDEHGFPSVFGNAHHFAQGTIMAGLKKFDLELGYPQVLRSGSTLTSGRSGSGSPRRWWSLRDSGDGGAERRAPLADSEGCLFARENVSFALWIALQTALQKQKFRA